MGESKVDGWSFKVEPERVVLIRGSLVVVLEPGELYGFGHLIQDASFAWHNLTGKHLDENICKSGVEDGKENESPGV